MNAPAPARTVLVVDDQDGVRNLIRRILTASDYLVIDADSGAAALEIAETHPEIALAYIDITMPLMDGLTLTAALRQHYPQLPIVLMSGFDMDDVLSSSPKIEPAPLFLEKPFTIAQLLQAADYLLASER